MPKLLLTGGAQLAEGLMAKVAARTGSEDGARHRTRYSEALLVLLDTDTGHTQVLLRYRVPPEWSSLPLDSHVFKAGSWDGDRLLLCTETTVHEVEAGSWRITRTLSHPWMNDVHHVARRPDGGLDVVTTGLDALLTYAPGSDDPTLASALPGSPWDRFHPGTDYRLVASTKPHVAHPNYVFQHEGVSWVSRCNLGDAVVAGQPERRMVVTGDTPIHDGNWHDGRLWFTSVDGRVHVVDPAAGRAERSLDLRVGAPVPGPLGWCRGLHHEGGRLYVGLSRIRKTTIARNLSWAKAQLTGGGTPDERPTRVVVVDPDSGRTLAEHDVEAAGLHAIFSILPLQPGA